MISYKIRIKQTRDCRNFRVVGIGKKEAETIQSRPLGSEGGAHLADVLASVVDETRTSEGGVDAEETHDRAPVPEASRNH